MSQHPMAKLFSDNAPKFVAAIIWKFRHILPSLAVSITLDDLASMADALDKAKSAINITVTGHGNGGLTIQMVSDDVAQIMMAKEAVNPTAANNMQKMMEARKEARELSAVILAHTGVSGEVTRAAQLLQELAKE